MLDIKAKERDTLDMTTQAKKTKVNAIQKDAFDQMAWGDVSQAKNVSRLYDDEAEEGVVQDVFNSLYKSSPSLIEAAPVAQKGVIKQMMGLTEFEHLRSGTQVDDIASALGTIELAPQVMRQFKEVQEKLDKKYGESSPGPDETLEEMIGEEGMSELRQGLRRAIKYAQNAADEMDGVSRSWGLGSEEFKNMPFEKRLELAERLRNSPKLKMITKLVGRFKNVVNAASTTVPTHGNDEIVDTGLGDDIPRLVPSEFFKFSKQKTLFYKDLLEKKLLNYNLKGVENLGRGPIIVCQDKSASMHGHQDEWATAVSLAIGELASKQNRAFGVIHFEASVGGKWFSSKNQKLTVADKIQMASVGVGGGTDFYKVLMAAFELRAKEPELKPCDIVLITDGEYNFTKEQLDEVLKLKKETNVRIHGIAVKPPVGDFYFKGLESFCDEISLVGNDGEIDVLKNIVNRASMPAA
jgi:uncharacterized protein with von Willebrand factor type A (vWA) domain